MKKITVQANANIALIKYWGKRDESLFLPTKSSLSVALDRLTTVTNIEKINKLEDEVVLDGIFLDDSKKIKVVRFLDLFRKKYGIKYFFKINSENKFPTGAGLASSASGFASLAYGLAKLCNLNLSKKELSILARRGSGSASRSLDGGFVIWKKGKEIDGSDSYAQQLFDENHWKEFCVLVVVVCDKSKKISSRDAMQTTVKTSPSYQDWLDKSEKRIIDIETAIKNKDFRMVGKLAEDDCLDMHRTMQDSRPSINYWQPATLKIIQLVRDLRAEGVDCFFTIDAGANVKILCLNKDVNFIQSRVKEFKEVKNTILCRVGKGAH